MKPHFRIRFRFVKIPLALRGTWFMACQWWGHVPEAREWEQPPWYPVTATVVSNIQGLRN